MKLTVVALGALSIVGGAAVAAKVDANTNPDTANYGTPPGAALKRDGSLSATGKTATPTQDSAVTVSPGRTDTITTTTTDSSAPAAAANVTTTSDAPVSAPVEPALAPRPDRN
ncbi:MAG: hypothetical protein ABJD97_08850 [Betaproteobacteria bacterium]